MWEINEVTNLVTFTAITISNKYCSLFLDYEGICSLVSKVNITTLLTLQLNDQQETLEDEESDDVCKQLAQTLGTEGLI